MNPFSSENCSFCTLKLTNIIQSQIGSVVVLESGLGLKSSSSWSWSWSCSWSRTRCEGTRSWNLTRTLIEDSRTRPENGSSPLRASSKQIFWLFIYHKILRKLQNCFYLYAYFEYIILIGIFVFKGILFEHFCHLWSCMLPFPSYACESDRSYKYQMIPNAFPH